MKRTQSTADRAVSAASDTSAVLKSKNSSERFMREVAQISDDTRRWLIVLGMTQDLRSSLRAIGDAGDNLYDDDDFFPTIKTLLNLIKSRLAQSIYSKLLDGEGGEI